MRLKDGLRFLNKRLLSTQYIKEMSIYKIKIIKCFIALLYILLLQSCKTNDDIICGDPIQFGNAFINIVDNNGNNLIENGTFNSDDIKVTFNGYTHTRPFFENSLKFENLIFVTVVGEEGDNEFKVQLSDSISDNLFLNLNKEGFYGPCGSAFFTLDSATYNGVLQTIEDFDGDYLITVKK